MIAQCARDNLTVEASEADRNGRRHFVIKWHGEELHRDVFDADENWRRAQCAQGVFRKLESRFSGGDVTQEQLVEMFGDNADEPDLTWVGNALIGAANAVEEGEESAKRPAIISMAELIPVEGYPRLAEPVIGGLLRRGETANIIAPSKAGKSWLAYGLGLSVRLGRYWLDTYPCRAGRVLYIDNELHATQEANTVGHRLKSVADAMGIQRDEWVSNFDLLSLRGRLLDVAGIARVLEDVEADRYDLVVLDAFYRALPAGVSENDNADMAALYNMIDAIAGRTNAAWVNIHHASKGAQGDKSVVDVGAGAGAQSRAADAHVVLREHEEKGVVVLEAAVRSFPPVEPLALRWCFPVWQPADGVDAAKLKGRLSRGEQRTNDRDEAGIAAVVGALKASATPMTNRKIRMTTELSKERADKLLARLERSGRIKSRDVIVKGNACLEYWLADSSANVVDERGHVVDGDRPRSEGRGVVAVSKEDRPPTSPHVVGKPRRKPTTPSKTKARKSEESHEADA